MPQRIPTTREIAAACGCNQSTASRALAGSASISETTRRHILFVAKRMGWRPNPMATAYMQHLRAGKSAPPSQATIAFLTSVHLGNLATDNTGHHLQRVYHGARQRSEEFGYSLDYIWAGEPSLTSTRLNNLLAARNVTGLIMSEMDGRPELLENLEHNHFSSVIIGHNLAKPPILTVAVHTSQGINSILHKTMELGYRTIAVMVSDSYDLRVGRGIYWPAHFLKQKHRSTHSFNIFTFPAPHDSVIPQIQSWIEEIKPEVILGEAIIWRALKKMKWRVPQDVAFISVDRSPAYPDIGGFDQRHEEYSAFAVDLLASQIVKNDLGLPRIASTLLVDGQWADGRSIPHASMRKLEQKIVNQAD